MKPRVNNPAWVRAIQDVIDALPSEPADQINADPNTTGFQQFLAGTGSMLAWWGDVGSNAKTSDSSVIGDVIGFSILPGSDDVYNSKTGALGQARRAARTTRRTWPISAGASTSWRASTAIQKSRRRPGALRPISAARTFRSGARPIRPASSPTATATSTSRNGSRPATTRRSSPSYLNSEADSYNHPNAAIEPRIPGIFQYYSVAEDELAKIFAGQVNGAGRRRRDRGAWEKITDQIGRDNQIKLYKASLGM